MSVCFETVFVFPEHCAFYLCEVLTRCHQCVIALARVWTPIACVRVHHTNHYAIKTQKYDQIEAKLCDAPALFCLFQEDGPGSILDKDPEAKAMLTLLDRGPHSEGLRDEDQLADTPGETRLKTWKPLYMSVRSMKCGYEKKDCVRSENNIWFSRRNCYTDYIAIPPFIWWTNNELLVDNLAVPYYATSRLYPSYQFAKFACYHCYYKLVYLRIDCLVFT